jgi:dihydroorotate dehydrogenase (NAD+) catalytic subunit
MTTTPATGAAPVDLSVEVCGIRFANPVLPAAGPPVRDGAAILACAAGGAGGLVAKTISRQAAVVPTPNMAEIGHGFLNTELWSELPAEQWLAEELPLARTAGLPLIVSLGYSAADISWLAPRVLPFADALELSTHYIGEDPGPMVDAIHAAKDAVGIPVFVKLSPLGREMSRAAEHAARAGADAVVAINSFGPCLAIDLETGRSRMGGDGYGWLSGPALKPLAVRCVYDVARAVDIPVIGCGGVSRGTDVIEMAMAGSSAVQVCTAAILRGHNVFGRIAAETGAWLAAHGYTSLEEVRGLAHRDAAHAQVSGPPVVDVDLCNGCALCVGSCVYDAIHLVEGKAELDETRCENCGLCITRCRPGALMWAPAAAPSHAAAG